MPTPSRIARYSASTSPKFVTHSQPASSVNPVADLDVIAWNAVSLPDSGAMREVVPHG